MHTLIKAHSNYIAFSAHKIRRILSRLQGESYQNALLTLEFLPYSASSIIKKLVNSAASNAISNNLCKKQQLMIKEIFANEGPKLKRIRPRAQGKGCQILKPTCHITVIMEIKK